MSHRNTFRLLLNFRHFQSCTTWSVFHSTKRSNCATFNMSLGRMLKVVLLQRIELSCVESCILNLFHMLMDLSTVYHHLFVPVFTLSTQFTMIQACLLFWVSLDKVRSISDIGDWMRSKTRNTEFAIIPKATSGSWTAWFRPYRSASWLLWGTRCCFNSMVRFPLTVGSNFSWSVI